MEQKLPSLDGRNSTGAYHRYRVEDRSYFSIIKKEIIKEAERFAFSAQKIAKLQIVINELITNLSKFGERKRELLWKIFYLHQRPGLEILTLDKGPGISNISQALEDGFSSSGTAGEGLGAIKRQADFFEIYSQPGVGTVVLTRFFASENIPYQDRSFPFAALSVAKPNETLCGDGYVLEYSQEKQVFNLLVLDGLGHGEGAFEASQAAIQTYESLSKSSPHQILREIHEKIKKTRGAVAFAARYHFEDEVISYCSVGNISGRILGLNTAKHFPAFNGIVGHVLPSQMKDLELPWKRDSQLFIHSDGLISRWDASKYPQIQKYDPAILAACLYRDYCRGNDDTTLIICKHPSTDGKTSKTYN